MLMKIRFKGVGILKLINEGARWNVKNLMKMVWWNLSKYGEEINIELLTGRYRINYSSVQQQDQVQELGRDNVNRTGSIIWSYTNTKRKINDYIETILLKHVPSLFIYCKWILESQIDFIKVGQAKSTQTIWNMACGQGTSTFSTQGIFMIFACTQKPHYSSSRHQSIAIS